MLDYLGLKEEDRFRPEIASSQFVTHVNPYQAQLINEDFTETLLGQPVKFTLQTWVASGVGPVKVALAPSSSNSLDASVQVLKSFTKGS